MKYDRVFGDGWILGMMKIRGVERLSKFVTGFLDLLNDKAINSKWGPLSA